MKIDGAHADHAAHALGVTPAALSQTIKKLEARLNVRLFERTTRSVNLTEAGRAYLERVAPALASLQSATEDLQTSAGVEGGTLRLTTTGENVCKHLTALQNRAGGRPPR